VLLMRGRVAWLVSVVLTSCVASCGGSAATPAPSHASNESAWQVILTVKTAAVDFGIPGIALDGHGNLFAAEFDDNLIYKYSTSGKLLAQWGGPGSGPGQLGRPDKLAFAPKVTFTSPRLDLPMEGTAASRSSRQPAPHLRSGARTGPRLASSKIQSVSPLTGRAFCSRERSDPEVLAFRSAARTVGRARPRPRAVQ
jgi:hypothetical protein